MCRKTYVVFFCFLLTSFFYSCSPTLKSPVPKAGTANFSRCIAIGGDFMAGYQDGALYYEGQNKCIPALLTRSFQTVGGSTFRQAFMPDNQGLGLSVKPWLGPFISASHLASVTNCQGISNLTPVIPLLPVNQSNPYLAGTSGNAIQNLAVPAATLAQYFNPTLSIDYYSGNPNPFFNRIASVSGHSTVYGDAVAQHATFVSLWVGMEDIFQYAANGGYPNTIPSAMQFSAYLDTLLSGLTAGGAKGVMATLPDFRAFPFLLAGTVQYNSTLPIRSRLVEFPLLRFGHNQRAFFGRE